MEALLGSSFYWDRLYLHSLFGPVHQFTYSSLLILLLFLPIHRPILFLLPCLLPEIISSSGYIIHILFFLFTYSPLLVLLIHRFPILLLLPCFLPKIFSSSYLFLFLLILLLLRSNGTFIFFRASYQRYPL